MCMDKPDSPIKKGMSNEEIDRLLAKWNELTENSKTELRELLARNSEIMTNTNRSDERPHSPNK